VRGALAGLGVVTGFTEADLEKSLAELEAVRAEADAVEAEIQALRTGRPAPVRRPRVADGPGRIQVPDEGAPAVRELPGGYVTIPVLGRVPVLAVGGVVAAILFFKGRN
jgi:hypothetical protein